MKSSGFHGKIWWISWNPADFMARTYISVLVLQKNTVKSTIHEIRQISWWNSADFMVKFGRFHGEIWRISGQGSGGFHDEKSAAFSGKDLYICIGFAEKYSKIHYSWNPADFMWKPVDFMVKFGRFHGDLADFMKSGRFHGEIQRISCQGLWFWWKIQHSVVDHTVYLYWFWRIKQKKIQYSWNLADFMVKSGKFHDEIWQISWWNLVDFIHEIRRISWLILKIANFFYNTYNLFFYVNQISNSLAMSSPRLSLWPGAISSS